MSEIVKVVQLPGGDHQFIKQLEEKLGDAIRAKEKAEKEYIDAIDKLLKTHDKQYEEHRRDISRVYRGVVKDGAFVITLT